MRYINDPNVKPILYTDLVKHVIKSGVQAQRAYIYLASLGVKGEQTRQLMSDQTTYSKPRKLAVNSDTGAFVMSFDSCKSCKSLHLS